MLIAVLAVAGFARAERLVNINLVVVESEFSPPASEQIRLFTEGIERLKEVKIKPRIIKVDIVPDFYNVNSLDNLLSRLYTWAEYGKKQRFKGVVFYSLPPMLGVSGTQYAAGQAGAICAFTRNKKRKFAEGVMRTSNLSGADRNPHSKIIALHEMLHLLGANHIGIKVVTVSKDPLIRKFVQVPNVMHPAAQEYATIPNLPILPLTHRQVGYCRRGLNVDGGKYIIGGKR